MAKRLLPLIFFLLTTFLLLSQGGFEYSSLLSFDQEIVDAIEVEEGRYVLACQKNADTGKSISFVELDPVGEVVQMVDLESDSFSLEISQMFFADDHYYVVGLGRKKIDQSQRIWVGKLTNEFTLESIWYHIPSDYTGTVLNIRARWDHQGHIAFAGTFITSDMYPHPFGGYINTQNQTLVSNVNIDYYDSSINDLVKQPGNEGYILYGAKLYFTDDLFTVTHTAIYNNGFGVLQQGNLEYLTDSTYLFSGKYYQSAEEHGIVSGICNDSFMVSLYDTIAIYPEGDPINFPAPKASLGIDQSESHFYLGGILNVDIFTFPYSEHLSLFTLVKYDMSLNKQWQKSYGGDAYYFMRGLLATSDGGCLMYGFRYQVGSQTEAYVLKVDGDGVVTSTTRTPLPDDRFLLYPNPFRNTIIVETSRSIDKPLLFKLFDATGRMVFESNISDTQQLLDLSFLNMTGIFTYKIEGQNVLQSGVLVKI